MISKTIIAVCYITLQTFVVNPGSQSKQFYDLFLQSKKVSKGQFKGFDVYELSDLLIYHGKGKKKRDLHIKHRDIDESLLFFHDTIADARIYHLKFFKSDVQGLPIVMMLDVESDTSLGQHIFLIKDKEVIYCGFINFAADDYNFSSLGIHVRIESVDERIILSFDTENIIDYSMKTLIDGSELRFEIVRGNIIRIQ